MMELRDKGNMIDEILSYLHFLEEEKVSLRSAFGLKTDYYEREANKAYDSKKDNFRICGKSPRNRLIIWCCLLPRIREKYRSMGVPEEVIQDTFSDLTLRSREYRKKYGVWGLTKADVIWFRHIHNCEIFQIGALQYQIFQMVYLDKEGCGEEYMHFSREQKEILPQGTPVLNVHIPAGADISAESVKDSIHTAKQFFSEYFPDFAAKAFICYSWLLYPEMLNLLPENSNIAAFASCFKIIAQVSDPYGSEAVKRIYGRRYPNRREYPKNTQLQRNALGKFSKLGMACGVIEFT